MDTMIDPLTMNGQTITLDNDPEDNPAHYNLMVGLSAQITLKKFQLKQVLLLTAGATL